MKHPVIDINCDMGEAFGNWRISDASDEQLMPLISSANVAAGFHAGDPMLMDRAVQLAAEHGVGLGAHPGYADLRGFGRRVIQASPQELMNDIIYQIGALREFGRRHGVALQHVKPHGALYMEIAKDEALSARFIEEMRQLAPESYVFCMDISCTYHIAKQTGQPVVREFFADRDYDSSGSIVFTRKVGQLEPEAVAEKVVRACIDGRVRTVDGSDIDIDFDSVCFHSDTPGCLQIATAIRERLHENNVRIAPVSEVIGA